MPKNTVGGPRKAKWLRELEERQAQAQQTYVNKVQTKVVNAGLTGALAGNTTKEIATLRAIQIAGMKVAHFDDLGSFEQKRIQGAFKLGKLTPDFVFDFKTKNEHLGDAFAANVPDHVPTAEKLRDAANDPASMDGDAKRRLDAFYTGIKNSIKEKFDHYGEKTKVFVHLSDSPWVDHGTIRQSIFELYATQVVGQGFTQWTNVKVPGQVYAVHGTSIISIWPATPRDPYVRDTSHWRYL